MSTPLEVATRGLELAQESLQRAEKKLDDWEQANEGYAVTHPKYLELKEAVNRCTTLVNEARESFNRFAPNNGIIT